MAELDDYSGEFKSDIRYEDFSKEALGRLIEEYCRLGFRLDGTWQEVIRKRHGVEEAKAAENDVWQHLVPFWQSRFAKAMRIQGNDVATYLKLLQMDPQMCPALMGIGAAAAEVIQGNLIAPVLLIKRLLPGMVERGSGTIMNVVSASATMAPPAPPSGMGKWWMHRGFARSSASCRAGRNRGGESPTHPRLAKGQAVTAPHRPALNFS